MKSRAYNKYIRSVGMTLCLATSGAQAQVAIIGDLNLPGLDLLGGLNGGLPSLDGLANINAVALEHMLSPDTLTGLNPATYGKALNGLTTILGSPQTFVPVPLAPPLVYSFIPGFKVLYTAPEQFPGYIIGGGTILDSSLIAVPAIPIVSAPFPADLSGLSGGLNLVPVAELGVLMSPEAVLSSALTLIP
ncbi:hypothetical protein DOK_17625 [gamma proteobacterium BDW918]|nr:hypothetical protein [Zhongshania aliphaticivorans]EIF41709.1 hypothetical protein DOK_17625 [gamma proteobacterium BDW918]